MHQTRLSVSLLAIVCWSSAATAGCALDSGAADDSRETEELGVSVEELTAGAPQLPSALATLISGRFRIPPSALDRLYTIDHYVPIGNGRTIHLTETLSARALLRGPRRAILMLPGPLTTGDFMNIDVPGYRGRDRLASRGFFAFSADFEGTGESSYPADGREPDQDSQVLAMKRVVQYIRLIRLTPKVDVLGESWAGGVAAEVCADALRVRSCTLASILYKTPTDYANQVFRSPEFRAFLDSFEDGYFQTFPEFYMQLVERSPAPVQAWTFANMPGRYTTAPLYDAFDLPNFDPSVARVPGRIIQGELDPNQPLSDAYELATDYDGGAADVVVVPGAGHIPRVEPEPRNEIYWNAVEQFIDP